MRVRDVPLSFETLLIAMLLLLFVPALVSSERVSDISRGLYTVVMLASLYLVSTNRKHLVTGIILFVPVMITKWSVSPFGDVQTLYVLRIPCGTGDLRLWIYGQETRTPHLMWINLIIVRRQ